MRGEMRARITGVQVLSVTLHPPDAVPEGPHRCLALGCQTLTGERLIFCVRHYRMVPIAIRSRLLRLWGKGRPALAQTTPAFVAAVRDAVGAVAAAEGRPPADLEAAWPAETRGWPCLS